MGVTGAQCEPLRLSGGGGPKGSLEVIWIHWGVIRGHLGSLGSLGLSGSDCSSVEVIGAQWGLLGLIGVQSGSVCNAYTPLFSLKGNLKDQR